MKRESEFRYTKLAGILREQILSGYIKPGQFLMSENELCRHYAMSRTSVRKSLEELLKEGLIVKKVGQGTIVSPDLAIEPSNKKVLRILATSPSHFMDSCMPFIIEEFEKQNPHVEVKCLSFPTSDFWESIRSSSQIGLQADIVFAGDRQFSEMEEAGPFLDLREPFKDVLPEIYPDLRKTFESGMQMPAIPVTFSPVYLVYNPKLFHKHDIPLPKHDWTKEDFLRAAQRLTIDTDGDGIIDQYGLTLSCSLNRWPLLALQNGVDFTGSIDREGLVKTLTFIHDLLYRYRIATLSPRYLINSEAFIRQKAGMVLTTSIELAGWRKETLPFEPMVASMPFGERKASLLIANAMMIPAASEEEELAIRFLKTALDPAIQERISREHKFLSVLQPVNDAVYSPTELTPLNIEGSRIVNSHFLHELFTDFSVMEEIEAEMELFWSGLESAVHFADRMVTMIESRLTPSSQ
ncbi:extracellular solute-binding protein [Paenibacillus aurantius]|uniref:Extracellular solute-binding protein n=1 Tax=Paenibacillus aurantius TaxID=2918900 RepID=A0AA96L9M1_9BACL|nr:extracellular solute-binding protein [Paenibacillus aurantius]WNQ09064.1 extracellular solute-binding protein [Paenibacillus aurantius]